MEFDSLWSEDQKIHLKLPFTFLHFTSYNTSRFPTIPASL
ncbi:hypothetical protein BAOM_2213 [Peribacillus asahii]|uniref:Uncharacterized protein n=1 Tax=Peribacillus asahii TaxID=228899 RepID=A0A3Q9RMD4_9BACI|nr:hypothetical protein BAOM_2213 [Peribacillus asahii]